MYISIFGFCGQMHLKMICFENKLLNVLASKEFIFLILVFLKNDFSNIINFEYTVFCFIKEIVFSAIDAEDFSYKPKKI